MLNTPVAAAILSVSLWTTAGAMSKKVSTNLGNLIGAAIVTAFGVIPMVIAMLLIGIFSIPAMSIIIAAAAGLFLTAGFVFIYKSLFTEQLTNAVALTEVNPAILVLFGILVLNEPLRPVQLISIIVIFMGAFLIITTERLKINRRLIPALLSPISWAIYWIMMTYAVNIAGTFAMPVAISRIAGSVIIILYIMMNKDHALSKIRSFKNTKKEQRLLYAAIGLAIILALFDATGDTIFSYVVGANTVTIGSALNALSPMAVSIFGLIVYRDRLTPAQFIGLIIMVCGALALSLL